MKSSLLHRARSGDQSSLGKLLDSYRNYLLLVARTQIDAKLRIRMDASDLVQETFLEAQRSFRGFSGHTEVELTAWLRRILVRNLIDAARHHAAQCRDLRRELSIETDVERSGQQIHDALGLGTSTPSAQAMHREQGVLLADAMATLPAEYREVLIQRQILNRDFGAIGEHLGKSAGAVRMLWVRALEKLRQAWAALDEPSGHS